MSPTVRPRRRRQRWPRAQLTASATARVLLRATVRAALDDLCGVVAERLASPRIFVSPEAMLRLIGDGPTRDDMIAATMPQRVRR